MSINSSFTLCRRADNSAFTSFPCDEQRRPSLLVQSLHRSNVPGDSTTKPLQGRSSEKTSSAASATKKRPGCRSYSPFELHIRDRKMGKGPISPLNEEDFQAWKSRENQGEGAVGGIHLSLMNKENEASGEAPPSSRAPANADDPKQRLQMEAQNRIRFNIMASSSDDSKSNNTTTAFGAPRAIRATPFEPMVHQRNLKDGVLSPFLVEEYSTWNGGQSVVAFRSNCQDENSISWKRRYQRAELEKLDARKRMLGMEESKRQLKIQMIHQQAAYLSIQQTKQPQPTCNPKKRRHIETVVEADGSTNQQQSDMPVNKAKQEQSPQEYVTESDKECVSSENADASDGGNPIEMSNKVGLLLDELDEASKNHGGSPTEKGSGIPEKEDASIADSATETVTKEGLITVNESGEEQRNDCSKGSSTGGCDAEAVAKEDPQSQADTAPKQGDDESQPFLPCNDELTDTKPTFINLQRGGRFQPSNDTSNDSSLAFPKDADESILFACTDTMARVDCSEMSDHSSPKRRRLAFNLDETQVNDSSGSPDPEPDRTTNSTTENDATMTEPHFTPPRASPGENQGQQDDSGDGFEADDTIEVFVDEGFENSMSALDVSAITGSSPSPMPPKSNHCKIQAGAPVDLSLSLDNFFEDSKDEKDQQQQSNPKSSSSPTEDMPFDEASAPQKVASRKSISTTHSDSTETEASDAIDTSIEWQPKLSRVSANAPKNRSIEKKASAAPVVRVTRSRAKKIVEAPLSSDGKANYLEDDAKSLKELSTGRRSTQKHQGGEAHGNEENSEPAKEVNGEDLPGASSHYKVLLAKSNVDEVTKDPQTEEEPTVAAIVSKRSVEKRSSRRSSRGTKTDRGDEGGDPLATSMSSTVGQPVSKRSGEKRSSRRTSKGTTTDRGDEDGDPLAASLSSTVTAGGQPGKKRGRRRRGTLAATLKAPALKKRRS